MQNNAVTNINYNCNKCLIVTLKLNNSMNRKDF